MDFSELPALNKAASTIQVYARSHLKFLQLCNVITTIGRSTQRPWMRSVCPYMERDPTGASFNDWIMSPDAVMITTPTAPFTIVWVNIACEDMYGIKMCDIKGQTPRVFQGAKTNHNIAKQKKTRCEDLIDCTDDVQRQQPISEVFINHNSKGEPMKVEMDIYLADVHVRKVAMNDCVRGTHEVQAPQASSRRESMTNRVGCEVIDMFVCYMRRTDYTLTIPTLKEVIDTSGYDPFLRRKQIADTLFIRLEALFHQGRVDDEYVNWERSKSPIVLQAPIEPYKIIWINDSFKKQYNVLLEDVVGKTVCNIFQESSRAKPQIVRSVMLNVRVLRSHFTKGSYQTMIETCCNPRDPYLLMQLSIHFTDLTDYTPEYANDMSDQDNSSDSFSSSGSCNEVLVGSFKRVK